MTVCREKEGLSSVIGAAESPALMPG